MSEHDQFIIEEIAAYHARGRLTRDLLRSMLHGVDDGAAVLAALQERGIKPNAQPGPAPGSPPPPPPFGA